MKTVLGVVCGLIIGNILARLAEAWGGGDLYTLLCVCCLCWVCYHVGKTR